MPTVGERLNASLREITQPLMQQLREVELEIEVREEELKELRAARTRMVTIARQIDPTLAPKKEPSKPALSISQEKVEAMWEWLTQNVNGDEFHTSGLLRREDFDLMSSSQASKALVVLHEQGRIRLVRSGSGGAKYFKVVT